MLHLHTRFLYAGIVRIRPAMKQVPECEIISGTFQFSVRVDRRGIVGRAVDTISASSPSWDLAGTPGIDAIRFQNQVSIDMARLMETEEEVNPSKTLVDFAPS